MKRDRALISFPFHAGNANRLLVAVLALSCSLTTAEAQPVFGSLTPPLPSPAAMPGSPSALGGAVPPPFASTPQTPPFKWAGIGFHPQATYRRSFADGMKVRPGGPSANTYLTTYSPSLSLELGQKWSANLSQSWNQYSNPAFNDSTAELASLSGAFEVGEWDLEISQSFTSSTEVLVETGQQTHQEISQTRLSGSRRLSNKASLSLNGIQSLNFIEQAEDPHEWSGSGAVTYQATSNLSVAIRLGAGYTAIEKAPDSLSFRPNIGMNWQISNKLILAMDAGIEQRRLLGGAKNSIRNPTHNLSVQFTPAQTTSISFQASQSIQNSYFRSELTKVTGWNVSLQQRLLKHFQLSGNYGRQKTKYFATAASVVSGRRDETENYGVRLGTTIFRRISISGFLQYSENVTNVSGFEFSSRQAGGEIGIHF